MFDFFGKVKLQNSPRCYAGFDIKKASPKEFILGVATGEFLDGAHLFMQTGRLYHPDAQIVIFCDTAVSQKNIDLAMGLDIVLQPINKNAISRSYHIQNSRFIEYLKFVLSTSKDSMFFLSDTRDVFFQKNIFSQYSKNEFSEYDLHVFEESNKTFLVECKYNSRWLRNMFGTPTLDAHSEQTIICSGTTLGNWKGMVEYLSLMISLYQVYPNLRPDASDQGAHNVIVRDNLLQSTVKIYPQKNELVYTYSRGDLVDLNESLEFCGVTPACVHQYDRAGSNEIERWLEAFSGNKIRTKIGN